MNEQFSENKTFDLSQNSFVIFMSSYAPGLIAGVIIIIMLKSFLPETVEMILYVLLLIVMIVKAIMSLQGNKRVLILSDSDISVYLKKRKNSILLTKINNDEVKSIIQVANDGFVITKINEDAEYIPLSFYLKPYKALLYSIKYELFKRFGNDKTNFAQDKLLMQYIETKRLPKQLLKDDNNTKYLRLFTVCIYILFAGLPTVVTILALTLLILYALIAFLKGLAALLSAF